MEGWSNRQELTPEQSNVLCWRIDNTQWWYNSKRRLWQKEKDVRVEYNLMNNLGFNLCVVPWSPVVILVVYFRVEGSHQRRGPKEVEQEFGVDRESIRTK